MAFDRNCVSQQQDIKPNRVLAFKMEGTYSYFCSLRSRTYNFFSLNVSYTRVKYFDWLRKIFNQSGRCNTCNTFVAYFKAGNIL